jgi:hypothetical protein
MKLNRKITLDPIKPRDLNIISIIQRKKGPHTDHKKQGEKEKCRKPVKDADDI